MKGDCSRWLPGQYSKNITKNIIVLPLRYGTDTVVENDEVIETVRKVCFAIVWFRSRRPTAKCARLAGCLSAARWFMVSVHRATAFLRLQIHP